jgi:hypothetical protein
MQDLGRAMSDITEDQLVSMQDLGRAMSDITEDQFNQWQDRVADELNRTGYGQLTLEDMIGIYICESVSSIIDYGTQSI